jgi:hypothetical protein
MLVTTVAPEFSDRRLYRFTSENLSEYLPHLITPQSKVLCVAASGDHCLNAVHLGARQVTLFDATFLSLCWSAFKIACIQTVTYQEFISTLLPSRRGLTSATVTRLVGLGGEHIPEVLRAGIMNHADSLQSRFKVHHDQDEIARRCNLYLRSEADYLQLRTALNHTRIYYEHLSLAACAARAINGCVGDRWDAVLLSNIADYCHHVYGQGATGLEQFLTLEVAPLLATISPNGCIAAAYRYDTLSNRYRSAIDTPELRTRCFAQYHTKDLSFPGLLASTTDAVTLVYEKHEGNRYE